VELGCGNVGAIPLCSSSRRQAADVELDRRTGLRLEVTRVAVRNLSAPMRDVELADGVLTRDAHSVVGDPTSTWSSRRSAGSSPPAS
jgi:homoserine dehydrogenase